jgi:lysophospholipase L1-like esterase
VALAVARVATYSQTNPPIFLPHERVLFQGDSITDGNRGRNEDPNHILGHGYVFTIAARYGAYYPDDDLTFINRGVSGNTVSDLASRWQTDTLDLKPDVVSILIGINDIQASFSRNEAFMRQSVFNTYDQLLARTKQALPKVKLILGEPFILPTGKVGKDLRSWTKAVQTMDSAVEELAAKYHAPAVRFQEVFDKALLKAPAEHWIWDGIHPTYAGHELMADSWIQAYNDFYVSPLEDPERNSALKPTVNRERDFYDWLHRHDDVLEFQKEKDFDVVLIGDSITHMWGGQPQSDRRNGQAAWEATFGKANVLNMGFGWDRTQNVLWRLEHGEMEYLKPRSIVLNIGTNNLVGDETARTNTPEETAAGIAAVVRKLRHMSPESRIYVMAVFPRGFERGNELDQSIRRLDEVLHERLSGCEKVTYLDIGAKLREPDGSITKSTFIDGTHPTDRGYSIWGQALKDAGAIPGSK